MPTWIPLVFCALAAGAIFPPFVPLAGPLSLDDLLPVMAGLLGLAVLPFSRRKPWFDATVIGFVLIALTSLVSNAVNAQTVSDFLRLSGRSTGRIIFYETFLLGARCVLDRGDWARRALGFFVAAATIESLFCIYAFFTAYHGPYGLGVIEFPDWSVLLGNIRVQGTFSGAEMRYETASVSPNFLAAYLLLSIPVTVGLVSSIERNEWRLALMVSALAQVMTLYLTYTRAALIAFGIGILAMGFLSGRRRLAMAALTAGIVIALAIPTMRAKLLGEGHDRWALYWASAELTYDHPVFGVGDGNYDYVLHENQQYNDTPFGIATTTSHNSVLLSAANYGIAGGAAHALLYLLLLAVMLNEMHALEGRPRRVLVAGVVAGIIGYLVQDQFNNLAYVPKVATQMWFLFALVPVLGRGGSPERQREPRVVRLYPMPAVTAKGVDHPHP